MKQMTLRAVVMLIIACAFVCGLLLLGVFYTIDGDEWALYPANRHIYTDGHIVQAGEITDRDGIMLAATKNGGRVFNDDLQTRLSTIHAVGDLDGYISTGLHTAYLKKLCGYNLINGVYSFSGKGNNINTTLSAKVSSTALSALAGRNGIVGVYNYKTGEVICMVSAPTFDVNDNTKSQTDGVYMNKFISGTYVPGSTFKLITAAAALDVYGDKAYDREYTCERGVTIDGERITCMSYHGKMQLKEALAMSCNSYFSQLAVDLGADCLTEYAEKLGFNRSFALDGIKAATSIFNVDETRDIDRAWAGMGQHTDMMNPLQYLTAMGAIANGGVPVTPYFIKNIKTPAGLPIQLSGAKNSARMLSEQTANKLAKLMSSNVELNYGKGNYSGLDLCAKSGTAEVGGDATPNAVFVGFTQNEDMPLAFVVVVENGGSGSKVAGAVARTVLYKCKEVLT